MSFRELTPPEATISRDKVSESCLYNSRLVPPRTPSLGNVGTNDGFYAQTVHVAAEIEARPVR